MCFEKLSNYIFCIIYLRDFKPANLLLFQGGRVVKIADMGISRMATQQSMTEFTGTQLYISPGKKIESTLKIIFIFDNRIIEVYKSSFCKKT